MAVGKHLGFADVGVVCPIRWTLLGCPVCSQDPDTSRSPFSSASVELVARVGLEVQVGVGDCSEAAPPQSHLRPAQSDQRSRSLSQYCLAWYLLLADRLRKCHR